MRTGKRVSWAATAAAAGVVWYLAWPASEGAGPASAPAPAGDNYFAFVKATEFAPPAPTTGQGLGDVPAVPAGGAPAPAAPADHLYAVEQQVRTLRKQGAGEAAVHQLRAATLSADTAARLAAMEQDEAAWQQRLQSFQADVERVSAEARGDAERDDAIAQLRASRFAPDEQAHVLAYTPPALPQLRQD